jgi:predicted  nucleic acid-binding Zn-ribbon protein
MTDNIDQTAHLTQKWLAEIQALRQHMAELQQKRDEAWESSQKWRQLYNTESEQRRAEAKIYQQALAKRSEGIASVKAELQQFQGINVDATAETTTTAVQSELSQLTSVGELKAKLVAVTKERNYLIQALKTEQENHAQTRNNLTTALGDAIDSLAKARAARRAGEAVEAVETGEISH